MDHSRFTLTGGSFQWDDPLLLEDSLTDEEKLIRDTARAYAQEKLAPRILMSNRHETFDVSVMKEMAELGFLGATLENYDATQPGPASAHRWATDYAAQFDEAMACGRSAILCGRTGTGKTHLAVAVLKHIMERRCKGVYTTTHAMLREVKDTWGKEATQTHMSAVRRYTHADLLVLDEVGVQFGSDAERIILFEILGTRYDLVLPTILISNLAKDDMAKFLGDRVIDRMRESGGKMIVFGWESHRRGGA